MPNLPANLNNPALLLALCLIIGLVVGVNATLVSLFRRGTPRKRDDTWLHALGGARRAEQQHAAQLAELHRAVGDLAANPSKTNSPNE